jgi:integration host factor subunit beta
MNKRELIAAAARQSSLTQRQMREALDALMETLIQTLAEGEQVALSDFGRFCLQHYPGRSLQRFDGEGQYIVEDRSIPVFKSSAALRRRLRKECS